MTEQRGDSDTTLTVFLKNHIAKILAAVIALLVLTIIAFVYWTHVKARKAAELETEPIQKEIAKSLKLLEGGLSFKDHHEMSKSFIQRLAEFQVVSKGRNSDALRVLDEAAKELKAAEYLWSASVQAESELVRKPSDRRAKETVQQVVCRDKLPEARQFCEELNGDTLYINDMIERCKELREVHWHKFSGFCKEAMSKMKTP